MDKHEHDLGLSHDVAKLLQQSLNRRRILRWAIGAGVVTLVGCPRENTASGDSSNGSAGSSGEAGSSASDASNSDSSDSCSKIPEETAGPYPGDGSNGVNALTLSGIVRSDIRESFAGSSGTAEGIPLTVKLKVVDVGDGCSPLAGYAVYLWHCDRDGNYSLYSASVTDQNYLRGVQESDDEGVVTFQTSFPGCYSGRWPHIHFEVYQSLDAATDSNNKIATSQLALPQASCERVYAEAGYEASVGNLQRITLASDNVFSDGADSQLPSMSGDTGSGFVATLTVAVTA